MNNNVIPFRFDSNQVRALTIDDESWFIADDIAKVLDFGHTPHMVRMLDDDETRVHIVDRSGGARKMTIINESGLYNAIFRSRKPEAQAFRKWVTGVVLPAIRATGHYGQRASRISVAEWDRRGPNRQMLGTCAKITAFGYQSLSASFEPRRFA